jgi:multidrug efflux system membrane fusion protein
VRANTLARTGAGSVQTADQRGAEQRAAQAAVNEAEARVRDALFDLNHTRITAPFTGRIGSHLISVGNLIAGSRAGTSPTTLLATLVSIDPIYLNFDMSEADYMTFQRGRQQRKGPLADKVQISLADEKGFTHEGTLDFVDNTLNRSSGTIHARATVPNSDLLLTPGGFARVRLQVEPPAPALLVPDASVQPDQSEHMVLIVGPNDVVTPKRVQLGDLRNGLRVIRSGLDPSDRVIIDGIPTVRPGSKVSPQFGSIRFASDQSRSSGEP